LLYHLSHIPSPFFAVVICQGRRVLDPKGLTKGMSRQDTNQEDQKADDQTGKFFIFALGL
jgi:hypothetical protein